MQLLPVCVRIVNDSKCDLPLAEVSQQMHEYLKDVVGISLSDGPNHQDDHHFDEYSSVGFRPMLTASAFFPHFFLHLLSRNIELLLFLKDSCLN